MTDKIISLFSLDDLAGKIRPIISEELARIKEAEDSNRWLSPEETCALFTPKISKTTLSAWTRRGLLNQTRMGGRVYYKKAEVLNRINNTKRRGVK